MKVVLFCGGQGMRLRGYSGPIPKPLVTVGDRPILWHLMRYYAHFGHTEFILCLGHAADRIKDYFLKYNAREDNDFVMSAGGQGIELLGDESPDWKITFADTGQLSNIGERLRRVEKYLGDDETFLANYADGLTDLDLGTFVDNFVASDLTAQFLAVPAPSTFHVVHSDDEGYVEQLEPIGHSDLRVNGGFFAFRREIFDVLNPNEELVLEPFSRLMKERKLLAVNFDGFWKSMDTFKDKIALDAIAADDAPPWQVWNT